MANATKEVRKTATVTNPKTGTKAMINYVVDFEGTPEARILELAARTLWINWQNKNRHLITPETVKDFESRTVKIVAKDVGKREVKPNAKVRQIVRNMLALGINADNVKEKLAGLVPDDVLDAVLSEFTETRKEGKGQVPLK